MASASVSEQAPDAAPSVPTSGVLAEATPGPITNHQALSFPLPQFPSLKNENDSNYHKELNELISAKP